MNTKTKKKNRKNKHNSLTKRDELILAHIGDFGLSIAEVIHHRFFENKKEDAVKSCLRRLGPSDRGLIRSHKLPNSKRVYYRLTRKGAKTVGITFSKRDESGISNLPQKYAMLWFTTFPKTDETIKVCFPRHHPELFSFGPNRLPKVDFYIAEKSGPSDGIGDVRLGIALTDFNSKHTRVVARAAKHLKRFLQHGWFDEIIQSRRLEIAVLTTSEKKKLAIELILHSEFKRLLGRKLWKFSDVGVSSSFPIGTRIVEIPGLANLISTTQKKDIE